MSGHVVVHTQKILNRVMIVSLILGIIILVYWVNKHGVTLNDYFDLINEIDGEVFPGQIGTVLILMPGIYFVYSFMKNKK